MSAGHSLVTIERLILLILSIALDSRDFWMCSRVWPFCRRRLVVLLTDVRLWRSDRIDLNFKLRNSKYKQFQVETSNKERLKLSVWKHSDDQEHLSDFRQLFHWSPLDWSPNENSMRILLFEHLIGFLLHFFSVSLLETHHFNWSL